MNYKELLEKTHAKYIKEYTCEKCGCSDFCQVDDQKLLSKLIGRKYKAFDPVFIRCDKCTEISLHPKNDPLWTLRNEHAEIMREIKENVSMRELAEWNYEIFKSSGVNTSFIDFEKMESK